MLIPATLLAFAALPYAYANAQYGSPKYASSSAAPSATAAASPTTHTVEVGQNGLKFTPDVTTAAVGEMVVFNFHPGNHSVTQAAFDVPCKPLDNTSFFSGFLANAQSFTIKVTSTDPIWFYCAQTIPGDHCQLGMVGAINPPASGNNLAAFAAAAAKTNASSAQPSPMGGVSATPTTATPAAATSTGAAARMGVVGAFAGLFAVFLL